MSKNTVVALTPETHAKLLAMAARWRAAPSISIVTINHDRLVAMGLKLLEDTLPWAEAEAPDPSFDTLAKVVAMLPPKAVV